MFNKHQPTAEGLFEACYLANEVKPGGNAAAQEIMRRLLGSSDPEAEAVAILNQTLGVVVIAVGVELLRELHGIAPPSLHDPECPLGRVN